MNNNIYSVIVQVGFEKGKMYETKHKKELILEVDKNEILLA